ncbi:late secretory pathway protein avl9-related [Anaeramoeba flamelloides]|uniref:Late secretory pathway protein avl9-related n=1 Tax=Anaeramoeba flamelloides TaxID=1746091 RepID=A0ABQ8YLB5_9EUKA|nr:late secretory pathway protein avl9-related [Anaeramoeba flamelloides]
MTAIQHIVICNFDHEVGNVVEYSYPSLPTSFKYKDELAFLSLPSNSNFEGVNVLYFTLGNYYCISAFGMLSREFLSQNEQNISKTTRNYVQKSVVVMTHLPLFSSIAAKLKIIVDAWFEQHTFQDRTLIHDLYKILNQSISPQKNIRPKSKKNSQVKEQEKEKEKENNQNENEKEKEKEEKKENEKEKKKEEYASDITDQLMFELPLRTLWKTLLGKNILMILKAMLLEKKILFYSKSADVVSECVITFMSLLPDFYLFLCPKKYSKIVKRNRYKKVFKKTLEANKKKKKQKKSISNQLLIVPENFGFPLHILSNAIYFSPLINICQLDEIKKQYGAFIIGSNNILLTENNILKIDMVINIDSGAIDIHDQNLTKSINCSISEKKHLKEIDNIVKNNYNQGQWIGSHSWIKQNMYNYFFRMVLDISRFSNVTKLKSKTLNKLNNSNNKLVFKKEQHNKNQNSEKQREEENQKQKIEKQREEEKQKQNSEKQKQNSEKQREEGKTHHQKTKKKLRIDLEKLFFLWDNLGKYNDNFIQSWTKTRNFQKWVFESPSELRNLHYSFNFQNVDIIDDIGEKITTFGSILGKKALNMKDKVGETLSEIIPTGKFNKEQDEQKVKELKLQKQKQRHTQLLCEVGVDPELAEWAVLETKGKDFFLALDRVLDIEMKEEEEKRKLRKRGKSKFNKRKSNKTNIPIPKNLGGSIWSEIKSKDNEKPKRKTKKEINIINNKK